MTEPSNRVHDRYQFRNAGKVSVPTNAKPAFNSFHVDRERLGTHEEWDPEAKNDYGGTGKYVTKPNSIRLNAISAMGDLRAKSSNRDLNVPSEDTGTGPHFIPSAYAPYGKNPMYKKRGQE
jgi:hypothetical protein